MVYIIMTYGIMIYLSVFEINFFFFLWSEMLIRPPVIVTVVGYIILLLLPRVKDLQLRIFLVYNIVGAAVVVK